jgi:hypothetical protein
MRTLASAGLIAPWKSMAMSQSGPAASRRAPNASATFWTNVRRLDEPCGAHLRGAALERGEARLLLLLDQLGLPGVGVDSHPVAGRAAQQLVDGDAERLPLDVPQGLVDAAQGRRQDGAAAVERVAVDRLPVVDDAARVLPDQRRRDLLDRGPDGQRAAFDDGLAEADDPRVGVHLEEEPARLDEERLELRDLESAAHAVELAEFRRHHRGLRVRHVLVGGRARGASAQGSDADRPEEALQELPTLLSVHAVPPFVF